MTLYPWLVLIHILAGMIWVGGSVILNLMGSRARRSGDPAARVEFARALAFFGPRALAPALVTAVSAGVLLVLSNEAWDFGQPWILLALALVTGALLIGGLFLGPTAIQLQRALEDGSETADTRRLFDRWILGSRLVVVILVVLVWDMVFKPGL